MDLEQVQVAAYLRSHPAFLEEWLERNADLGLFEAVKKKWSNEEDDADHDRQASPGEVVAPLEPLSLLPQGLKKALEASSLNVPGEEPEDDTLEWEPSFASVVPRTRGKSVTAFLIPLPRF